MIISQDNATCPVVLALCRHSFKKLTFATLGSFLANACFYFILYILDRHRSPEWNARMSVIVAATIQSVLCFVSAVIIGPWPLHYIAEPNMPLHNDILVFTEGSFLFELVWWWWWRHWKKRKIDVLKVVHHLIVCPTLIYFLHQNTYGAESTVAIGVGQATVPWMHVLWMLKKSGYYKHFFGYCMDCYYSLLNSMRHILYGMAFFFYMSSEKISFIFKFSLVIFYITNLIIYYRMCVHMYGRLVKRKL